MIASDPLQRFTCAMVGQRTRPVRLILPNSALMIWVFSSLNSQNKNHLMIQFLQGQFRFWNCPCSLIFKSTAVGIVFELSGKWFVIVEIFCLMLNTLLSAVGNLFI